jgi:hypothetical protein
MFDTGRVEYVKQPPPWEAGRQGILNALEAQVPQHTFGQPVPVVARIVWEDDGDLADPRYPFTATWLDAADVTRRIGGPYCVGRVTVSSCCASSALCAGCRSTAPCL